jgi:hypothetical protein
MSPVQRPMKRLAVPVIVLTALGPMIAGCTGHTDSGWRAYRQPPGPMPLSFRYPAGWHATGHTTSGSMGNVGSARVTANIAGSMVSLASANCAHRTGVLGSDGVDVTWSATIDKPQHIAGFPGVPMRVNGHDARLAELPNECVHGGERIFGVIQESSTVLVFMGADVGTKATPKMIANIKTMFESATYRLS